MPASKGPRGRRAHVRALLDGHQGFVIALQVRPSRADGPMQLVPEIFFTTRLAPYLDRDGLAAAAYKFVRAVRLFAQKPFVWGPDETLP